MYDAQTNRVFFSGVLPYEAKATWENIRQLLADRNIYAEHIIGTKDIWARDYMPVQVGENSFVKFKYRPDYLVKTDNKQYITTYPKCSFLDDKEIVCCDVVLDGGNIVVCGNKVILTEKVFRENNLPPHEITKRIEEAFGKQVIYIPCDPHEIAECEALDELPLCHADGMVHTIDNETILLANYVDYDLSFRKQLLARLKPYFKIKEFQFGEARTENSWIYINYLQIGQVVLMPCVGEPADDIAAEQLKKILNVSEVVKVDSKELTFNKDNGGGSLHCISWNVYDPTIQSEG